MANIGGNDPKKAAHVILFADVNTPHLTSTAMKEIIVVETKVEAQFKLVKVVTMKSTELTAIRILVN